MTKDEIIERLEEMKMPTAECCRQHRKDYVFIEEMNAKLDKLINELRD